MRLDAGLILGWKYGNAEGIVTVDGKVTQWPASLGDKPTQKQIDELGKEYDAYMKGRESLKADEIKAAFSDAGQQKIIIEIAKITGYA